MSRLLDGHFGKCLIFGLACATRVTLKKRFGEVIPDMIRQVVSRIWTREVKQKTRVQGPLDSFSLAGSASLCILHSGGEYGVDNVRLSRRKIEQMSATIEYKITEFFRKGVGGSYPPESRSFIPDRSHSRYS